MGDVHFTLLHERAKKLFEEEVTSLTGRIHDATKPDEKARLKGYLDELKAKGPDAAEVFLFAGLDLKGRLNYAYEAKGTGLRMEASFNPLGLIGLNTEFGIKGSGEKMTQECLIAFRGPSQLPLTKDGKNQFRAPQPILVQAFRGQKWTASTELSFEASLGWSAEAGGSVEKSPDEDAEAAEAAKEDAEDVEEDKSAGGEPVKWEAKSGRTDMTEEEDPEVSLEIAAARFEAKVGAEACLSYQYETFAGECVYPLAYDVTSIRSLREDLIKITETGSYPQWVVRRAHKLVAKYKDPLTNAIKNTGQDSAQKALKQIFDSSEEPSFYEGSGTCPSEKINDLLELLRWLRDHLTRARGVGKDSEQKEKGEDWSLSGSLQTELITVRDVFQKSDDAKHAGASCFLSLTSHDPRGKVNAFAKVEAEARIPALARLQATVGVEAGFSGGRKVSYARFEQVMNDPAWSVGVTTTFDTRVVYSQFKMGAKVEASADATVLHKKVFDSAETAAGQALDALFEKVSKGTTYGVNRMRYRCAISVWQKPPLSAFGGKLKATKVVPALQGTGVAYGESCVVGNLRKIYKRVASNKGRLAEDEYVSVLAASLKVDVRDLGTFLTNAQVKEFLSGRWQELDLRSSVFVESTFAALPGTKLRTQPDQANCVRNIIEKDEPKFVTLHPKTPRRLFKNRGQLESIRLRFRRRDHDRSTASMLPFPLGFCKVLGTGFAIDLYRVEEAGTDALIDLVTVFFHRDLIATKDWTDQYERAVPAAVLFGQ